MGPPRTYSSVDDRRHPERHTRECATIPSGPRPRLPTRIKPRTRRRALESRNSHESHTRSAGQGEQCWQASLPAYTFLPRVPGRRGPRAAIRFQSPRLGSPYQPRSGAHHAQGVQNSSLNPGEPPRGGTPLTHSRAESPPREDRAGPGGVPRTRLRSPKFSSTYLGASSLFPPERSSPRPNNSPDIPRRQGRRLVHAAHHTHLEGGRRSGGRGSTVSRQGKTQPGLTRGTARG